MQSRQAQAEAIANLYQPPSVGRPSDIGDPIIVQQFLDAVAEGNYIETACHLVGLSKVTVYSWIKRGDSGESPFDRFANAVKGAEARAEAKMVANVRRASELPQFWAAAATHLERRHPDRWGKRQDDQAVPRVVVQIGVGQGEVKVGIIDGLSPANINDLACANHSQVEMLSPINRDYVNQPALTCESVPGASESDRRIPAVESRRGPYLPAPLATSRGRLAVHKGRIPRNKKKAADVG
jgi:transposase